MADDRTQFYIDILAKMTGGDSAVASVSTLGDTMLAGKATVADFERTIKSMSTALEESGAAAKTTSDAVSVGEAKYGELETAANKAAKAVERMAASGKTGEAFLKKQAEAVTKAEAAAVALKAEAVALDALKAKANAAAVQHEHLVKGLASVKSAAEKAAKAEAAASGSGKVNEIAEALGKIGGPAGVAGQKIFGLATGFKKLSGGIGSAALYVGIAVGIVAIAAAAIAGTIAIGKWAVGLADANRTQSLLSAGVAQSIEGGAELDKTIARLGDVVPQTREELLSMAGDLAKTGLRGKDLTDALETAAVKAAKLKWGPDFAKQLIAMDVQTKRLGTNLAGTFGGLNIEKLLGGFSTLVALFDSSTESGKALKFLFESLFQPIIDGAAGAIPSVERLFLQAEILALEAYIATKPYHSLIGALAEAFLITAQIIGGVLAVAIAGVVGAIAQVFGPIKLLVDLLGHDIIAGLVNGITAGATAVADAIGGVVTGGIKAAKHLLGIGSPSKVFAGIGGHTAEGFAQGVEGGAGDAQSALEAMVAAPSSSGATAGGGSQFGNITIAINVDGKGQSDDGLAAKIAAAVRDVLESDALMLGGGEAA